MQRCAEGFTSGVKGLINSRRMGCAESFAGMRDENFVWCYGRNLKEGAHLEGLRLV
jgi:hypothetical protein